MIEQRNVYWYKNNVKIEPDNRINFKEKCIEQNGSIALQFELLFNWTNINDIGIYKIVVKTASGSVDSSAELKVLSAQFEPPKIIKNLINQIIAEGDALIFEIKVEGDVKEVKWLKNNKLINHLANAIIEKIENDTFVNYFFLII